MKTQKFLDLLAILAIFALAFVACDNGTTNGQEKPQARTGTITVELNKACTINIKGTMLEAEWNTVRDNLVQGFNAAYATGNKNRLTDIFGDGYGLGESVIIFEKTTTYNYYNYKAVEGEWTTLHLNQDYVLGVEDFDDLGEKIINAANTMSTFKPGFAQATPIVSDMECVLMLCAYGAVDRLFV